MKEEGCILIQTCDKYQMVWKNLFWSMKNFWDFKIPWKIYFCNEEKNVELPNKQFHQIKTGVCSHSEILKKSIEQINCDYIFYMLDDFWPTKKIKKELFLNLFNIFKKERWNSLKVCPVHPSYYQITKTDFEIEKKRIFKFDDKSKWRFNQQASFWPRELLLEQIIDSNFEGKHESSLSFEIDMDENYKLNYPESKDYIYNYFWYPVGGSYWRRKITLLGEQIEFERKVEEYLDTK